MRSHPVPAWAAASSLLLSAAPSSAEAPTGPWRSLPLIDRAQVVAATASPVRPGRWLMAAEGGGLFRSEDAGNTWQHAGTGLPRTAEIRLLAGSAADESLFFASPEGRRVFRSTDAGDSWIPRATFPSGTVIGALLPDAADTLVLRAGVTQGPSLGVWRSTDGGATWTPTNDGIAESPVRELAAQPGAPSQLLAGTGTGIARSTDAGLTWAMVWTGAAVGEIDWNVPSAPGLVRALGAGSCLESTDAGATWAVIGARSGSRLVTSPVDPMELYVAYTAAGCGYAYHEARFGAASRSTDGGATWTEVIASSCEDAYPLYPGAPATFLHVEDASPAPRAAVAWSATRLARSDANGAPGTWSFVDGGLHSVPVSHVRVGADDRWYVRSPWSQSLFTSTDGGASWDRHVLGTCEGPLFAFAVSRAFPDLVFESGDDFCEYPGCGTHSPYTRCSTDRGVTWDPPPATGWSVPGLGGKGNVTAIALGAQTSRTVYVWEDRWLYRRDDPEGAFQLVSFVGTAARDAAFVDGNPACMYAAFVSGDPVRFTTDGGLTWSSRSAGLPRDDDVVRLLLHPANPVHVLAAFRRHGVFETTDSGITWAPVPMRWEEVSAGASAVRDRRERALPGIRDAAWDTSGDTPRVFLATDRGVAIEGLGMVTAGLTSPDVTSVDYSAERGVLLAGTAAHGAFALELTPIGGGAGLALAATGSGGPTPPILELLPSPNPFRSATRIRFAAPRADTEVLLRIFDVSGRTVRTLHHGPAGPDPVDVSWDGRTDDGRAVPAGVYFVNLTAGDRSASRKIGRLR